MNEITLNDAQQKVDEWIKTVGVKYFGELTNLGILMEEVGELSRHMVRLYGEQSYKKSEDNTAITPAVANALIADEMADVLWVLLCLANQTGVNLTEAFFKTILKKTERDINRHKQNKKLL